MSNLRTNYQDDVFTGKRKYTEINNGDGTVSFDDVTDYAQVGDSYGAAQINETNDVVNNLDASTYKKNDSAETSIDDDDYFPIFDTSANVAKKTLWSNLKNILTNVFAIKTHASSSTTFGTGSENLYGHVKLSDSYTSSAGAAAAAVGASSKAVNDAYNANRYSITSLSGTVTANAATETSHYNSLNNGKAPTYHASTTTTYGKGTTTLYGHLRITDGGNPGTAAEGVAASAKWVSDLSTRETNHHNELNTKIDNRYNDIVGELTANDNRIYMDYQNGKYGYNTAANRGADTFHPFKQAYELLGSADFDITNGATTQVSINLSKVPDDYIVCITSVGATSGHFSGEHRAVGIMSHNISGNTCNVTLSHDSYPDHAVNINGTLSVYGA